MKWPEMELLFPEGMPCRIQYRPIKFHHLVAGFSYGIEGEWTDENGQKVGSLLLPRIRPRLLRVVFALFLLYSGLKFTGLLQWMGVAL